MVMWSAVKGLDLTLKPPWRKRQSDVVTSGWLVGSPGLLGRCPEDCGRIGLGGNAEQRQKGAVPSPDARPRELPWAPVRSRTAWCSELSLGLSPDPAIPCSPGFTS